MRIHQGIEYLSQNTRQSILGEHARRLGLDDKRDVAERLTDPLVIESYWHRADENEREVIRLFVTSAARGFLRKKEWEKWVQRKGRLLTAGLNKLRRLGMILTVRKMWGEVGYQMPQEVREGFTLCLIKDREPTAPPAETLPYYITAGRGIHLDLIGLFIYLRGGDVPITQKGQIHRRILLKLAPLLSISDAHVSGWAEAALPDSPKEGIALTVVLDLAVRLGLIRMRGRQLVLNRTRLEEWLQAAPEQRWDDLYDLLAEEYLPHDSWWDGLATRMKTAEPERWNSLAEELRALAEAGFELPEDAADRAVNGWLHLLLGFGWIQMGQDTAGGLYWRWSSLPRLAQTEGWFIDPAGTVTIPPLVPLAAIWQLSRFCPLDFHGDFLSGTLQPKPLQAYLSAGGTEEEAIRLLQRYCHHPVPEPLVQMIRQWGRETRQIQLEPFIRVRVAHPGLLAELRDLIPFQPYLSMIIAPTDFLISPSQEKEVVALFRKFGYEPHQPQPMIGEPQAEEPQAAGYKDGLFTIARPWDGYAVENTFPDQLDGMRELSALPKMWTQHFQSYHPQTMRTLLQRAAELGLEIQAELADRAVRAGVPREVAVDMGYWYVSLEQGKKKQRYRLDEIQRVRIVLPESLY